ncbi:choice-of-anchor J domain-containing protein [Flavobacterium sp. MMLR14_040]|uniref:T9SS-dependent choice-of-anchor J family protein n=1 Tax=Flavobacterium sp. MMLR14_040 TaxID=3093843 RepID=UPI00298FA52F|nr:choice-of-anchor J domain-containing protein [Flavobacterium sp. MMLR14_040]MDW8849031.1 choice-of-anchor J domain-containing protein [Flavobacterium sp. MMLR14_040]
MKNIYSLRHLMTFLSFFCCFSINLFAQTMPDPQTLPYSQNFSGLLASSTTYPLGFQGWLVSSTQNTATYSTALSGDRGLIANSTVVTNSGNVHNYNGKIGFLNTTSADFAIGVAFVTTGNTAIKVQYDAMVMRNPYDGASNNRLQEMALQYRIGTTGVFITLPSTAYSNNSTVPRLINPVDEPIATKIEVTLPAECDNQPIVQIRWIARLVSGSTGSRQSFAIDNIKIGSDITPPVNESGYPKVVEILSDGFDFFSKINKIGKTYYVLVASGSAEPTPAQIKDGLDADGNAVLQAGFLSIANKDQEYSKIITGLTLGTSYIVYSVSEDLSGNMQTAVNKIDVTTASVLVPSLRTTVSVFDFGNSEQNIDSASLSYQISGTNITDVVTLTATANFSISKDNVTFQSSLVYNAADFAANATPEVYVRFTPNTAGAFSGTITHETTGALVKTVSLSGIGTNPYVQGFNDTNVLTNSGWTQYNVAGTTNKWASTSDPRNINSGAGAVLINGYSDSGASKDWLISPKLHLDTFTKYPLLSFYSRKFYAGPNLKLLVSTNYDGISNPELATWTEIEGKFPTITGTYTQSQFIDLSDYKTPNTYVAWVYETTGGNNAAEWSLDDVAITDEAAYVDSNPVLDFGDANPNTISASLSFDFKSKGYGDITLTAPADFQLSLDNITFQSSVLVNVADAVNTKTIYARFTPSSKALAISGTVTVTGTSLNKQIGLFAGSSIPKADTFDVVTYNLEFFASNVIGNDGKEFGPTDDDLQIENVAKVMNKLNADVYVVQEVSNDAALNVLIQKINVNGKTFDKTISPTWSYSFQEPDPKFPPQKLVVLYNTQTTTVKKTRVMFQELYDEIQAGTKTLPNYPVATTNPPANPSASFFSSGRLPYMVTIETNIGGIKKEIKLIDIHARANSGSDILRYNMRKYDAELLRDSLVAHYPDANLILLGDFNDDVKASVITPNPSSYEAFVNDTSNFNPLTLEISKAGAYSFLSSGGFLDHIVISNELSDQYLPNSIAVYDPRSDIQDYTNTTSDHGPVIARFELKEDALSTIDFDAKKGFAQAYPNPATDVVNIVVKTTDERNLKLKLYDISGRLVGGPIEIKGSQDSNITAVQVSNLRSGIYVYTLSENNKVVFKDKIIKK